MKLVVTMKSPSAMDYALEDLKDEIHCAGSDEAAEAAEERYLEAKEFLESYMEFGEYLRVEFDTDTGDAKVLKA